MSEVLHLLRPAAALVLSLGLAGLAGAAEPAPAPAAEQPSPKKGKTTSVAVLDLTALGISPEVALNLTAIVAAEVGRYDDVKPVTRREVAALLDLERQKQLLGCNDDSCLSQVVGALGVAKIVSGQIGRIEGAYVLTLNLIDTRSAKVEARAVRTISVDAQKLVEATKSAVTELIGPHVSSTNQPPRLAVPHTLVAHEEDKVTLDASRCYDPDGDPLRIRWRQVSGPPAVLENGDTAKAEFAAAEVGLYTFSVEVSDGRSAPQEQKVEVEVRRRKRFGITPTFQTLLSFNRVIEQRLAAGESRTVIYRNRALLGGALLLDLSFNERWRLIAEVGANTMHVTPEDAPDSTTNLVDVLTYHVMIGVRHNFVFESFSLFFSAEVGVGRRYFAATYYGAKYEAQAEALMGDVSAGVDVPLINLGGIPFGEYCGIYAQGGLRVMKGTDVVGPFPATIPIAVPGNGFQWGVNATIGLYFRL